MKELSQLLQMLQVLSKNWKEIKSHGGTIDVDLLMEHIDRITREYDCFSGDMQAMGGLRGPK